MKGVTVADWVAGLCVWRVGWDANPGLSPCNFSNQCVDVHCHRPCRAIHILFFFE